MEKKLLIIILAIIFGIIGGVFGEIVTRAYLIENSFNIPFFGEIDYARNLSGNASLIFRDAKKVVVEQDQKVIGSAAAAGNSLAGIYKKDDFTDLNLGESTKTGKNSVAFLNSASGEAVIITSDGWLMSNLKPEEMLTTSKEETAAKSTTGEVLKNYRIVTKDGKIFSPDNLIIDKSSSISFWHIKALDLPVAKFFYDNTVSSGQLVISTNWRGWIWLGIVLAKIDDATGGVISSENYSTHLILDQTPRQEFHDSFLYNLNGEIVGLINGGNSADSIDNYNAVISSFLKTGAMSRPSLGVNYIDLSNLIGLASDTLRQGALIAADKNNVAVAKGSVAEKAELQAGDIITAVNGTAINSDNKLNKIINQYLPGDEISITYQRSGQDKVIKLKLDASK